jgi:hypothetical protein
VVNLILTVCLAANPSSCRTEQLAFESSGDLKQCMFMAPPEIAKWTEQHPALNVVRWKCAAAGEAEL